MKYKYEQRWIQHLSPGLKINMRWLIRGKWKFLICKIKNVLFVSFTKLIVYKDADAHLHPVGLNLSRECRAEKESKQMNLLYFENLPCITISVGTQEQQLHMGKLWTFTMKNQTDSYMFATVNSFSVEARRDRRYNHDDVAIQWLIQCSTYYLCPYLDR